MVHQVLQEFQSVNIIDFAVTMHTAFTYNVHSTLCIHQQFTQSFDKNQDMRLLTCYLIVVIAAAGNLQSSKQLLILDLQHVDYVKHLKI